LAFGAPKFSVHVYCGQTAGWIKVPLGTKVGRSPGDSVLDGDPAHSPQRGWSPSPIFGPLLLWPNCWMHQDATLYGGIASAQATMCQMRTQPPYLKMGGAPQFSAVYCGEAAAWIKIPLGTLCSMWTQLRPEKRHIHPTQFLANIYCGQMAGWMKTPLGTAVDLCPDHILLDGVPY